MIARMKWINKKTVISALVVSIVFITALTLNASDNIERTHVGDIPLIYIEPSGLRAKQSVGMVIWLDGFTGNKERTIPYLKELADAGYLAVSFDKYMHGERGTMNASQIWEWVQNNFRGHFWKILGHSSDDARRVIDWAYAHYHVKGVCMGGYSMGGDIALSVSGVDTRVECVAGMVTAPDWKRPGRRDRSLPITTVAQKLEMAMAQAYYDRLDPMSHLKQFNHKPAIFLAYGADDTLIKYTWGEDFINALRPYYSSNTDLLLIKQYPHTGHIVSDAMWGDALSWFAYVLKGEDSAAH